MPPPAHGSQIIEPENVGYPAIIHALQVRRENVLRHSIFMIDTFTVHVKLFGGKVKTFLPFLS